VLRAEGLNVYDVLRHSRLLISKAALAIVEERLKKRKRAEAAVEAIGASA
jgi:ribosomal protein L4